MGERQEGKSYLLVLNLRWAKVWNYEAKEYAVSINVLTSPKKEEEKYLNSIILPSSSTVVSSQPKRHIKKNCQRGLNSRKAN